MVTRDKTLESPNAKKTETVHNWLKSLDDDTKLRFAINWKMPHSLFNVACELYPGGGDALQDVDWFKIFQSSDLGVWSHGGQVICQSF